MKVPKFKKASKAAAWIASKITKDTWYRGNFAADKDDVEVAVGNPKAAKFCALGWIEKADQGYEECIKEALMEAIDYDEIADWNDDIAKSYVQVASAFKKAAKRLEKMEAEG